MPHGGFPPSQMLSLIICHSYLGQLHIELFVDSGNGWVSLPWVSNPLYATARTWETLAVGLKALPGSLARVSLGRHLGLASQHSKRGPRGTTGKSSKVPRAVGSGTTTPAQAHHQYLLPTYCQSL